MNGLLTIEGLDKISKRMIGFDYYVANMVTDRSVYRIFLNDVERNTHKRDLRLHRYPNRKPAGGYKLEYGSTYKLLSKGEISDLDLFVSSIERLIY
jgi:hypothetical protein